MYTLCCFKDKKNFNLLIKLRMAAGFLIGIFVFGAVGAFIAKDYIQSLFSNAVDDFEEDGGQKTRIRHEGNL